MLQLWGFQCIFKHGFDSRKGCCLGCLGFEAQTPGLNKASAVLIFTPAANSTSCCPRLLTFNIAAGAATGPLHAMQQHHTAHLAAASLCHSVVAKVRLHTVWIVWWLLQTLLRLELPVNCNVYRAIGQAVFYRPPIAGGWGEGVLLALQASQRMRGLSTRPWHCFFAVSA